MSLSGQTDCLLESLTLDSNQYLSWEHSCQNSVLSKHVNPSWDKRKRRRRRKEVFPRYIWFTSGSSPALGTFPPLLGAPFPSSFHMPWVQPKRPLVYCCLQCMLECLRMLNIPRTHTEWINLSDSQETASPLGIFLNSCSFVLSLFLYVKATETQNLILIHLISSSPLSLGNLFRTWHSVSTCNMLICFKAIDILCVGLCFLCLTYLTSIYTCLPSTHQE